MVLGRKVYGVDVGATSIKIACLAKSGSQITVADTVKIPLSSEHAAGTDSWLIAASQALAADLRARGMKLGSVVLGVGGRDTILRYSQIPPVPDARLGLIMRYQINEIAGKTEEAISADYKMLPIKQDFSDDLTILIALAKEKYVSRHLQLLSGISPRILMVNVAPVALYNAYLVSAERLGGQGEAGVTTLVANIGAENTDLTIIQNRGLIFARSVSKGSREFTEAVAESCNLSIEDAEKVKVTEGIIKEGTYRSESERKVCEALTPVASEFAALFNSSIQFAKTQVKLERLKINRVFLTGGGALLGGFAQFLSNRIGVPVQVFDPVAALSPVSTDTLQEEEMPKTEFATSIGLAASALAPDALAIDLLPERHRKRREFRERTRFLVAAGAASLLFLIIFFIFSFIEGSKVQRVEGTRDDIVSQVDERTDAARENELRNLKSKSAASYASLFTRRGFYFSLVMAQICDEDVTPSDIAVDDVKLVPTDAGRGKKAGPLDFRIVITGRTPKEEEVVFDFRNRLRTAIDETMKETAPLEIRPQINIDPGSMIRKISNELPFEITLDLNTEASAGERNMGKK